MVGWEKYIFLFFSRELVGISVGVGLVGWMSRLVLKTKKPIFLLFLEVPGCSGCVNFGNGPLSDLLLVEAVVKEFIPGCIQVFTTEEIAQRMVKVLEKQNVPFYLKQIPMNYQNWKKITLEMYRYLSGEVVLDGVISTTAGHLNGEVVMVEYYEKIISEKMFHSIDGLKVIDYDMKRFSKCKKDDQKYYVNQKLQIGKLFIKYSSNQSKCYFEKW